MIDPNVVESFLYKNIPFNGECDKILIDNLINQKWNDIFQHKSIAFILKSFNGSFNVSQLKVIAENVNLKEGDDINRMIFYTGIAALQMYVIENFLSPINDDERENMKIIEEICDNSRDSLISDGENIYELSKSVSLLNYSRVALFNTEPQLNDILLFPVWKLRHSIVHQLSLNSPSNSLYERIKSYAEIIDNIIKDKSKDINVHLAIQLYVEISSCFLWYGDAESIKYYSNAAKELSKFNINLTGAVGVRTKFQQNPLPQLLVHIEKNEEMELNCGESEEMALNCGENEGTETINYLPKDVALNDDTLLPNVKYLSSNNEYDDICVNLIPTEQLVFLVIISRKYRLGSSDDELLHEELITYLDYLISKTTVWCIKYKLLCMRSMIERNKTRKIDRSMMQMNELIDIVTDKSKNPADIGMRLQLFYSTLLNPIWINEKCLADILISMGAVKSALEIYQRLQLWDEIIQCYLSLKRRDKAEEIIRQRLAIEETPYLYCLLGDSTDNIEYYEKAWTLSDHKYPRAAKSLGNHYFDLKQYDAAIPYYDQSLELNSIQTDVWYRLAYATLIIKDYERSAVAYRRVIYFDSDNFEAWNNISKVYIKLNQKHRAWKSLREAIKCKYDEWKIWENYIGVSIDIGAFSEVIIAWHRIIDIKGKYEDEHIMEILVNAIINDIIDINGESAKKYAPKTQELLGRISSIGCGSFKIYRLYAKLLLSNATIDYERVIQCLQNCHRAAIHTQQWDHKPQLIVLIIQHCLMLADEYCLCADNINDDTRSKQIIGSCKLAINSVIATINKQKEIWDNERCNERNEISHLMMKCNEKLNFITEKLNVK